MEADEIRDEGEIVEPEDLEEVDLHKAETVEDDDAIFDEDVESLDDLKDKEDDEDEVDFEDHEEDESM